MRIITILVHEKNNVVNSEENSFLNVEVILTYHQSIQLILTELIRVVSFVIWYVTFRQVPWAI